MKPVSVLAGLLLISPAAALQIEIRYDYDTNGFFDQPGAREAIEAVAGFFGERIQDSLPRIDPADFGGSTTWHASFFDPATGANTSIEDLVVPEDTLIVFVGGRNLGGASGIAGPGGFNYALGSPSWYDLLFYRGQPGASASPATDFGPWGGAIAFNNSPQTEWTFQLDGRPVGYRSNFVSIALHEMAHVLGFGTSDSWDDRIVSGNFTGSHAVDSFDSFGANVPLEDPDPYGRRGHWAGEPESYSLDSLSFGSFGRGHGLGQEALMDPVNTFNSSDTFLNIMTDIDLAALVDIGWEIIPPQWLDPATVSPAAASFSWPSSTWLSYRVVRSGNLSTWPAIYGPNPGNGEVVNWQDPSPPMINAYYRLQATAVSPPAAPITPPSQVQPTTETSTILPPISLPPREVEGCGSHRH